MTQEGVASSASNKDDLYVNPKTPQITVTEQFGYLASANFSNDSINESPEPRKSNVSPRLNHTRRPRPVSAFLLDSSNSISEDGDVVFNNTPRSRNSMTFGGTFTAIVPPPPPQVPQRSTSPVRAPGSPVKASPFNFKPQEVQTTPNQLKPSHRKGHKYKHSSVSMNFFQEPPPKESTQIPNIPDHFPIPTFKETIGSVTHTQKLRLLWSCFHIATSIFIFIVGFHYKLPSLSTLAHLVFYDAIGSSLIVIVDIMSNFDVWNQSSITFPFGLGRIEVLAGFALSSWLIMVGFDLFSHLLEEFVLELVDVGKEEHGASHHVHGEVGSSSNWVIFDGVLILTLVVCFISSNYILSFDRISEMMKEQSVTAQKGLLTTESESKHAKLKNILKSWKKNPSHIVTITYTLFLICTTIIPTSLTSELSMDINEIGTFFVATFLVYNGWKLVKLLGRILLCSFPYSDNQHHLIRDKILNLIETSDFFKKGYRIDKLFITKFNYQVFVVGVKINMVGADNDEEVRVRFEVNRIITKELQKLEENKVEITIDIDRY